MKALSIKSARPEEGYLPTSGEGFETDPPFMLTGVELEFHADGPVLARTTHAVRELDIWVELKVKCTGVEGIRGGVFHVHGTTRDILACHGVGLELNGIPCAFKDLSVSINGPDLIVGCVEIVLAPEDDFVSAEDIEALPRCRTGLRLTGTDP